MSYTTTGRAQTEAVEVEYDGVPGVWVPELTAKRMFADASELKPLREKMGLIDTRLALKDERIQILQLKIENSDAVAYAAEEAIDMVTAEYKSVKDRLDAWYRNPLLWLGVGVVVGAVGTAALAAAL